MRIVWTISHLHVPVPYPQLAMSGEDNIDKVSKGDYIDTWTMSSGYQKKIMGSILANKATTAVVEDDGDKVVLETEITNKPALKLYDPTRKSIETEEVNPMTN